MNVIVLPETVLGPDRFAYRVLDACAALGISRTSLYELIKTDELRIIRLAGRTLVPRSELERLTSVPPRP